MSAVMIVGIVGTGGSSSSSEDDGDGEGDAAVVDEGSVVSEVGVEILGCGGEVVGGDERAVVGEVMCAGDVCAGGMVVGGGRESIVSSSPLMW